jgi:hypothetical protein
MKFNYKDALRLAARVEPVCPELAAEIREAAGKYLYVMVNVT